MIKAFIILAIVVLLFMKGAKKSRERAERFLFQ